MTKQKFMFDTKKCIDSVWLLVLTQIGNQLGKLWSVCDTLSEAKAFRPELDIDK